MLQKLILILASLLLACPIRSAARESAKKGNGVSDQDYVTFSSYSPSFEPVNNLNKSAAKVFMDSHNFKTSIKGTYMEFDISYERRYSNLSCYLLFCLLPETGNLSRYEVMGSSYDAISYQMMPTNKSWTVRIYLSRLRQVNTEAMIYVSREYVTGPRYDITHHYATFMITDPNYHTLNIGFTCIYYGIYINENELNNYYEVVYVPWDFDVFVDNPYRFTLKSLKLVTTPIGENGYLNLRGNICFSDVDSLYRKIDEDGLDDYKCTLPLKPESNEGGQIHYFTLKKGYYLDRNYFSVDKENGLDENNVFVKDYLFFTRTHHENYKVLECKLSFQNFGLSSYSLECNFRINFPDGDYLENVAIVGSQGKKKWDTQTEVVYL